MGNMDDFNFYLKLTKPLILDLPSAKDRAMAALWVKKLREVNANSPTDNLHVEYLKLLLVAMQENQLAGVFETAPPSGDLHELLPGVKKAQEILHLTRTEKSVAPGDESKTRAHPRVVTSIGGDMCEYVAVQEIPNFGIHGYYALSTEPLSKWSSSRAAACDDKTVARSDQRDEDSAVKTNKRGNATGSKIDENSKTKHERTKHSEKSLRKIFQAQRSEIAGVETRPCWGRSRYIDRLIDESPHLVGDLDLSEADALLHHYRDTKFRRKEKTSAESESSKACAISSRRRRVETRLDMPPCAFIPDDNDYSRYEKSAESLGSRTCKPRNLDMNEAGIIEEDDEMYDEYDEDYCPGVDFAPLHAQGYDYSDDQCESELVERTDYDDSWRDCAFESAEYEDEPSGSTDEPYAYFDDSPMGRIDSDAIDDMRRLVADPSRREPPSRGKVKVPRRKPHPPPPPVEESNVDAWDPPSHSTRIHH